MKEKVKDMLYSLNIFPNKKGYSVIEYILLNYSLEDIQNKMSTIYKEVAKEFNISAGAISRNIDTVVQGSIDSVNKKFNVNLTRLVNSEFLALLKKELEG